MLAGSCHGVLKKDVLLVFGCHEPVAEQRVVVSNNLGRSEQIPIPGAMRITDQGDIYSRLQACRHVVSTQNSV